MLKIAAICTTYYPGSHADVIASRWLDPHPADAQWGWRPQTCIASLYVAQIPPDASLLDVPKSQWRTASFKWRSNLDLATPTAREYGVPMFRTIREALTLGGDDLAVDGVLLIGEHGDYPVNEFGQTLYPRKELFDEIVAVFREAGRSVPLFNDKHLSWNMAWAQEMVSTSRELKFPMMAGSSLPYSFRLKPPLPHGADLAEAVMVFYGGTDVYGFHSLEAMQAFVETRAGGESGIQAVTTYADEAVWDALEADAWSRELFDAALATCERVAPGDMRENCRQPSPYDHVTCPTAFVLEHADGLRTTHIQLQGHVEDFGLAIRRRDGVIHANRWEEGSPDTFYGHFATLDAKIQDMFLTGQPPAPIERNLLTTMTIATCLHALATPGARVETPHLLVAY
jgi:hypothetical protein